jgi:hypothetical protein
LDAITGLMLGWLELGEGEDTAATLLLIPMPRSEPSDPHAWIDARA